MLKENQYTHYLNSLANYNKFLNGRGEIVIATNNEGIRDGSFEILTSIIQKGNLPAKIVVSDVEFGDNQFDGKLKNLALQKTKTGSLKIQMDLDEIFVLSQFEKWQEYSKSLIESDCEALFIPSVDLYGSVDRIKHGSDIGYKWRLHKDGLFRGVWPAAKINGTFFDTSKSDSCELLTISGELAKTAHILPHGLTANQSVYLNNYIYTLHLGYLSLQYREHINKRWWNKKWQERDGQTRCENSITNVEKSINHNLFIDEETLKTITNIVSTLEASITKV